MQINAKCIDLYIQYTCMRDIVKNILRSKFVPEKLLNDGDIMKYFKATGSFKTIVIHEKRITAKSTHGILHNTDRYIIENCSM